MKFFFPAVVLAACAFVACSGSAVTSIEREDLFSLDIGPLEDQMAMYTLDASGAERRAGFTMRDGGFYITDGNSAKIARYNSYGDLLFMIYNDEVNPQPVSLKTGVEDNAQVTRWAYAYPLRSPGGIAVDSRKHIYAEDRLPRERYDFDAENKSLLDSIVLHFDEAGRFVEYLGQGGKGGSPFPRISGIYTSAHDEIAVVCRTSSGWYVYWFNAQGEQLFLVQLKNSAIPLPPEWTSLSPSVDMIAASVDSRKLYIKVDYYQDIFDKSTNIRTGDEAVSSNIWILDVEDGSYTGMIAVPFFESSPSGKGGVENTRMLYSMLGVIRNGMAFLYFPVETGYSILLLDVNSQEQRRVLIRVDPSELHFNAFSLSPEGILSAMLVDDWQVKLVWWRMDTFSGGGA